MSAAAVAQVSEAQPVQYVVQAPQLGGVYAAAPQPISYVGASGAFPIAQPFGQAAYLQGAGQQVLAEGQQIQYIQGDGQQLVAEPSPIQYLQAEGQQIFADGQQIQFIDRDGQQILGDGQQIQYVQEEGQQVLLEGQQLLYGAPMVVAAPARVNVSHEIFAKLAAGGSLTPDEMSQLSGQPAPASLVPGSPRTTGMPTGNSPHGAAMGGLSAAAPGSAKASGKKDKKDRSGSKKALKASKKKKEKGCC